MVFGFSPITAQPLHLNLSWMVLTLAFQITSNEITVDNSTIYTQTTWPVVMLWILRRQYTTTSSVITLPYTVMQNELQT